jgi:F-box interacting protein
VLSELIPDDLMINILPRLPVQSLVKFQCVNNSWCSLIINDPAFKALNLHLHLSDTNSNYLMTFPNQFSTERRLCSVIIRNNNGGVSNFVMKNIEIPFRFRTPTDFYRVLCSLNGVLCMADSRRNTKIVNSLYLWNPSIRKFKIVPCLSTPPSDTNLMISILGIGLDHRDHDVLFIRIIFFYEKGSYNGGRKPITEVYSLNTNSWSTMHESVEVPCLALDEPTVFVNGAIHWEASSFGVVNLHVIMYFNTAERVFRTIPLPVNCLDFKVRDYWRLAVFQGLLALIVISRIDEASIKICDIWIMEEYGVVESWTKRFAIPISLDTSFARPVGITKNDQLILNLGGTLFWYDLDSEHGGILGFYRVQGSFDADTLTDSLYLLEPTRE